MTRQDLICRILECMVKDMEIIKAKNADYSSEEDALDNFRDFGAMGIVVRIGDKYKRLKTFAKAGSYAVKGEGFLDSIRDLRIYGYLAEVVFNEEILSRAGK